jgi:hypothetical protein
VLGINGVRVKILLGLIVAAVFLGVAGHGAWRNMRLRRSGGRAMAEVIDIAEHTSSSSDGQGVITTQHKYNAVLRFTTAGGHTVTAEECNGDSSPHCQRGQQVPVRYDVANPRTVEIDTVSGRGNAQLLIGLISAVAIIVLVVA